MGIETEEVFTKTIPLAGSGLKLLLLELTLKVYSPLGRQKLRIREFEAVAGLEDLEIPLTFTFQYLPVFNPPFHKF